MDYDLGAFWSVRPGTDSMLYHALSGKLTIGKLTPYLSWQIAVTCSTPGFGTKWWGLCLGWGPPAAFVPFVDEVIAAHTQSQDKIQALAEANALTITAEDGLDWLRATLRRKPWYSGPVPRWTKMALRGVRTDRGWTNAQMATWLGQSLRAGRVASWLSGPTPDHF